MTEFVDYLCRICQTLFAYLSADIPDDQIAVYIAFCFCLLAVLVVLVLCLHIVSIFLKHIFSMFRRWR